MILIDAIYIYDGGGKVLFDLLVNELQKKPLDIHYLVDKRIEADFRKKFLNKITFLKPSFISRTLFYIRNYFKFKTVFCFSNIPPPILLPSNIITYFHNVLYLEKFSQEGLKLNLMAFLKKGVAFVLRNNTNIWVVQTEHIKKKMENVWQIPTTKIRVLPFYKELAPEKEFNKKSNEIIKFLYVSAGHKHKNHTLLLSAFARFVKAFPNCQLYITIGSDFPDILKKIQEYNIPEIVNLGNLPIDEILELYLKMDIVIYPSLHESFGLGLIEASKFSLPIMAPDLPYVYSVVTPNMVFDPLSEDSIFKSLTQYQTILGSTSTCNCESKLDELVTLITE
jgi:glycosyltransferase involved in cell wall biosynthesis